MQSEVDFELFLNIYYMYMYSADIYVDFGCFSLAFRHCWFFLFLQMYPSVTVA